MQDRNLVTLDIEHRCIQDGSSPCVIGWQDPSLTAAQDGNQYIQISAGHVTHEDSRSRGYTFVARTVFLSREDMDYYDNEDAAHGEIKALLKGKIEDGPPLVVYMDG